MSKRTIMFNDFDPSLLDDPKFKEDSVREEIVVPILKRLGYTASGPNRIIRSKTLLHPFVMIGSKKHPVSIVPDYLLCSDGRPALIIETKRPDTELEKSKQVEQAYSYAIHPEVRVGYYALCNGRQLVAYDIYGIDPIFTIEFADIDRHWDTIESVLAPRNVAFAPQRHFAPDFGIAVVKAGFHENRPWLFPFVKLTSFTCVDENLFTMSVTVPIDEVDHLVSLDAEKGVFMKILTLTNENNRDHLLKSLAPGQLVYSKYPIYVSLNTIIGNRTQGQHEVFVPFVILDVLPLEEKTFREAEAMLD